MKFGSSWKIQSPCLDCIGRCVGCIGRCVGCHSMCDKYAHYLTELNDFKNTIFIQKDKERIVNGYIAKEQIKNKRSHKKYEV